MNRKEVVDAALRWNPAQQAVNRWMDRRLRVLCYHAIDDGEAFARQLQLLNEQYQPVTLSDVVAAVEGKGILPRKAVLVTFDDGLRSHVDVAMPALNRAGIQGTFFVVTGALGSDQAFWWEHVLQLQGRLRDFRLGNAFYNDSGRLVSAMKLVSNGQRLDTLDRLVQIYGPPTPVPHLDFNDLIRLSESGHAVGNHSSTHPLLDRCTDDELYAELVDAHRVYCDVSGTAPKVFAYPNGNHDARVRRILTEKRYQAAFLFDHAIEPIQDSMQISRLRMRDSLSGDRFAIIMSGLHPWVVSARSGRRRRSQ